MLKELIEVCNGRQKADLILDNCRIVNVFTERVEEASIATRGKYIAHVGDTSGINARKTVNLRGKIIIPGLIDGHIHIESSCLTVSSFAQTVVPLGTTAVVIGPHEIANVLGIRGVRLMLREAETTPLKVYAGAPPCVPATNCGLETSGARLGPGEIKELFDGSKFVNNLGEVMNFPGVINEDPDMLRKIRVAENAGATLCGHCPGLTGKELSAYIDAGMSSDHESTSYEEALEKIKRGMWLMIREGSSAKNMDDILPGLLRHKIPLDGCMFVSDDRHASDLVEKGHMNYTIKKAMGLGLDACTAIRLCTLNPAFYFNLKGRGAIAPGYKADLAVLNDLREFDVSDVYVSGKKVVQSGNSLFKKTFKYPEYVTRTVKLQKIKPEQLEIKGNGKARVIGIIDGEIETESLVREFNGISTSKDLLEIAVSERHGRNGDIGKGLVKGFGLRNGALAGTVSHDSHNLVCVGTNTMDMALCINRLREIQGGFAVASEGKILGDLQLQVAGLMSWRDAKHVSSKIEELSSHLRHIGCKVKSPFTQLSFLSLPVVPELKITDRGLVENFKRVPLFIKQQ